MTPRAERPLLHIRYAESDEGWVHGEMMSQLGLTRDQVYTRLDYELGELTVREIERGIEECGITVVVISAASRLDRFLAHAKDLALHATVETGNPRIVILTRGVSAESLSLTERALVGLDCSNQERTAESLAKLREFLHLTEPVVERPECPYPGLDAFQASNRDRLFGRDQDREEILRRVRSGHPRILLLGPSGSGKSSLIHAAVLPALPRGEYLVEVVPEQGDLVAALRTSVAAFQIDRLVAMLDDYAAIVSTATPVDVEAVRRRFDAIVVPDPRRRVLVVDPLEAIFTDHDKARRAMFFHMLGALWSRPWCTVILCLRSDLQGGLRLEPCWRELEGSEYVLRQLTEAGLRDAIVEPARRVDVYVEPALVERLIREVDPDRSSSALPMLQVALEQLWERLEHRYLTLESYEGIVGTGPELDSPRPAESYGSNEKRESRGLTVALSVHADRVLQTLSTKQREIAKRILLDLVHLGEGRPHTRRRRTRDQLGRRGDKIGDVDCVLRALLKGRLITADGEGTGVGEERYFHLTHDALIQGWTLLATLVRQHQQDLAKDRRLEAYKQRRDRYQGRLLPRWGWVLGLAILAATTIGAWRPWSERPEMSACERAASDEEPRRVLDICLEHNQRTGDPDDLIWASEAHLALGGFEKARELGHRLIKGLREADGHRILGNVILQAEPANIGDARSEAAIAITGYLRTDDLRGLTRGEITLSQVAWKQGDFTAALAAADEALALVDRLGDVRNRVAAHLRRADALGGLGDVVGARDELRHATDAATTACDKTWAYLKTSVHEMDSGRDEVAANTLGVARDASHDCHHPDASHWIDLMAAWLMRRRDPDGALMTLNRAASLGTTQASLLLRADLAAQRDALADAEGYLAQADAAAMDPDWAWKVACARAELAELRGGPDGDQRADLYYQRAIDRSVERRGCPFTPVAHVPTSRRRPIDGLLALYARTGRWHELIAVILELEASDSLRSTTANTITCEPPVEWGSRAAMRDISAGAMAVERMLAAWRSRDLVIVIAPSPRQIGPGHEHVYRLQIIDGEVTGEEIGDANEAARAADTLFDDPGNVSAARRLGRMIVPPGSTGKVLDVLALGALAKVPLAALRDDDGSLSISRRPLARVLALRPGAAHVAAGDAPVILADSKRDLPGAAQEGLDVERATGYTARRFGGDAATLARLRDARHAELLHVSGHASEQGRWSALDLADGSITSKQIAEEALAPRLAVLVVSRSAIANDDDHFGSIASAFLEAGTATVIATDHIIQDNDSSLLVEAFYNAFYNQPDCRTDPARALARAQQAVSSSKRRDPRSTWARFAVFRRPPDEPKGDVE